MTNLNYKAWAIAMDQRGFSLTELLVAMFMAALVGMAGYVVFSTSNRSYMTQGDVSEAQQNVRVAMDRLASDIRTAGFGLPNPPFSLAIGGQNWTAPVTVTNNAAGPDTITLLGIGFQAGTLVAPGGVPCNRKGDSIICMNSVASFFPGGMFNANTIFINVGGAQFIQLAGATLATNQLNLNPPNTLEGPANGIPIPAGTPVYIIQAVQYTINTALPGCSVLNPCLASNDFTGLRGVGLQVLTENIEDIQFAYGLDATPRDGVLDDANLDGAYTAADFLNAPAGSSDIIAVRANILSRTRNPDPNGANLFTRPALEDRPAAAVQDGFRRRLLTKVITLRNFRLEP